MGNIKDNNLLEIRTLKKMLNESTREVEKIRRQLDKTNQEENSYQVKAIEAKLAVAMESVSKLHKDLMNSWKIKKY